MRHTNIRIAVTNYEDVVLMAEINKTMVEHDMYKNYTMREVVNILAKLRVQDMNNSRIYPITKEQRIYEAFGVAPPTE